MSEQDYLKADSLQRKLNEGLVDTLRYKLMYALQHNDVARQNALLKIYGRHELPVWITSGYLVHHGYPDMAETILGFASDKGGDAKRSNEWMRAHIAIERGRITDGENILLNSTDPRVATGDPKLSMTLIGLPFAQLQPSQIERLRIRINQMDTTSTAPTPRAQLAHQFKLYQLAMLSCQEKNVAQANDYANRIAALPTPPYWSKAMQALATSAHAHADIAAGKDEEAWRKLQSVSFAIPWDLATTPAARNTDLVWRVELLYRLHKDDEAIKYGETLLDAVEISVPVRAYIALRLAQLYDRKGNQKRAIENYEIFLRYWKNPDPALQGTVNDARTRLAALTQR